MAEKLLRTVQAATLLPGDIIRRRGRQHAIVAVQLVPHQVLPAVEICMRDTDGHDERLVLDAYLPVPLLVEA